MCPSSKFTLFTMFQSTPPARGATVSVWLAPSRNWVSIHTPREGGDYSCSDYSEHYAGFNPHPPRGGRPNFFAIMPYKKPFQSTPPARGATLVECVRLFLQLFQSTPPARGATNKCCARSTSWNVSIHTPREGGDGLPGRPLRSVPRGFNPHPPRGGRLVICSIIKVYKHSFNPHPPRGGRHLYARFCVPPLVFQSTPPARGATSIAQGSCIL